MKNLFKIFEPATFRKIAFAGLAIILLEYMSLGLILPFINLVIRPELLDKYPWLGSFYDWIGFSSYHRFVLFLSVLFALMFFLKTIIAFLFHARIAYLLMRAQCDLTNRILSDVLSADYRIFIERSPSKFVGTIRNHAFASGNCLQSTAAIATEGLLLLLLLALALWLNPLVTMILIAFLILVGLLLKYVILDQMHRFGKERTSAIVQWRHFIFGLLSAIRDIKIMGMEDQLNQRFRNIVSGYRTSETRYRALRAAPKLLGELCFVLFVVGAIVFASVFQVDVRENLPALATLTVVMIRIIPCVHKIYGSANIYRYSQHALEELLNTSEFLRERKIVLRDDEISFARSIELRGITARYADAGENALEDVTLTIPKAGFVGIVGRSGSGKSTLFDVFVGLLEADRGTIFLDGREVDPFRSNAVRRRVGYVPQKVTLLDDTIAYNIALEPDSLNFMPGIERAAAAASVNDFIEGQPDAYQTFVGEGGVRMSGGQRQRIGIARALYKNPDILLFDEATSGVDAITEREILASVRQLAESRTVLFATHRLSTVKACDFIVVLNEGRVAGTGTHDDLLSTCPVYREMLQKEDASESEV